MARLSGPFARPGPMRAPFCLCSPHLHHMMSHLADVVIYILWKVMRRRTAPSPHTYMGHPCHTRNYPHMPNSPPFGEEASMADAVR